MEENNTQQSDSGGKPICDKEHKPIISADEIAGALKGMSQRIKDYAEEVDVERDAFYRKEKRIAEIKKGAKKRSKPGPKNRKEMSIDSDVFAVWKEAADTRKVSLASMINEYMRQYVTLLDVPVVESGAVLRAVYSGQVRLLLPISADTGVQVTGKDEIHEAFADGKINLFGAKKNKTVSI